jgi:folate-binding protein YgfZ
MSVAPRSTALRLTGNDVLPLLHRTTTAFLEDLAPGRARFTLFCDFRGRLVHRALVARTANAVWLLREDAPGAELAAFVDRSVFRDDVAIEDWSERLEVAGTLDLELEPGSVTERDGRPARAGIAAGASLEILAAGEAARRDDPAWERARIAAGRPRHGHEIAAAFTPFEVGLWSEVHLDKGCYTGQEVLLRLMTYESVKRRLATVAGPGETPATPATLETTWTPAAVLTSARPDGDGWSGLAVLPHAACEAGARVSLADGRALTSIEGFAPGWPLGLPRPGASADR